MNKGKDDRVKSLLEPIGLLDNFIDNFDPNKDYCCDYNEDNFERLRRDSFKYIKMILKQ